MTEQTKLWPSMTGTVVKAETINGAKGAFVSLTIEQVSTKTGKTFKRQAVAFGAQAAEMAEVKVGDRVYLRGPSEDRPRTVGDKTYRNPTMIVRQWKDKTVAEVAAEGEVAAA